MITHRRRALGLSALQLFMVATAVTLLAIMVVLGVEAVKAAAPTELFISEYIEGTSNNKALEIYNGTGAAVDLAAGGYNIQMFFNGSGSAGLTINLSGTVADGDVFVLAQSSANATILAQADQTNGSGWYNGNDAVVLRRGTAIIDSIGQVGFNPGSEWGTGLASTADNTLRRMASVCAGDADATNPFDPSVEWDGYATDTFDGLGAHTSTCNGGEPPTPTGSLVINEIDYDQPSTDTAEFVEIKNVSGATLNLQGYSLALVNGNGATVYSVIGLPIFDLAPGDYFVVCANAATVANCDLDVSPDTNLVQNGAPDAVTLYQAGTLIDTVSYEGDTAAPYTEGSGVGLADDGSGADVGISRYPDGFDSDQNNADFSPRCITPGEANTAANTNCEPPPVLEIWEIQGLAHQSAQAGNPVMTPNNVVTAVKNNGFWLQTPDSRADADAGTSNGIFVFTSSSPTVAVGDLVNVTGVVSEFRPGGSSSGNLTTTEIVSPTVTLISSGNPLPAPVVLGNGGRVPPNQIIEDDAAGSVETTGVYDPNSDGIDFYESLEGMRVQVNDALVVGATNGFGEIWVVGDSGANAATLTPRGGILISATDFNPERIQLDDTLYTVGAWPQVNVGARLTSPAVGVLDYNFGNFEVLVTDAVTVDTSGEVAQETTTLVGAPDRLTIATFNVENLGGNAPAAEFASRAALIVDHMHAPDILVLEEIQDNNGTTNDGTTDASVTFNTLISAVQTAGGPSYAFSQIDPVNLEDGGAPGGNIRVGFLYNPARVNFSARPGGDAITPASITCTGSVPLLDLNPSRIDPLNAAFDDSRKPLVGEFEFNGETVFVVGVHFNSKGGDEPLFGVNQPPTLVSETQRVAQAQVVNAFADTLLACNPAANIIVLGDLNDFQFSTPIAALKGGVLHNLMDLLPTNEQYSYVFDGNSQVLDQMVASGNMVTTLTPEYDVVHVNAEFTTQVSDHDPGVSRFQVAYPVSIDIRPSSTENRINCRLGNGVVTVAILTTDTFDALTVDHTTVTFEGASEAMVDHATGEPIRHEVDVDDDGDTDLLFFFRMRYTDLTCSSTSGRLEGMTYGGVLVAGEDVIQMVPLAFANRNLVQNGDFSQGAAFWESTGNVRVANEALQLSDQTVTQDLEYGLPTLSPVELTIGLGNSGNSLQTVRVTLSDSEEESEAIQCAFVIPANTPLTNNFAVRGRTTADWGSIRVAVETESGTVQVDNVSVEYRTGRVMSWPNQCSSLR